MKRIMTLLYRDDLFLDHETGRHPERPARLLAIHAGLDQAGLTAKCTLAPYASLSSDAVAQLHDRRMIERVRVTADHGGGMLDPDTVVSEASYRVGLAAAG